MAKVEKPIETLKDFLPDHCFDEVMHYLHKYHVHLTIAKNRASVLGDYRPKQMNGHHRISVNGGLNKYAFLITLLHELAHLLTYEQYKNKVQPHGVEWKNIYASLLSSFINNHIFPDDIKKELIKILKSPSASSCAEEGLQRILYRYDKAKPFCKLVEDLEEGDLFQTPDKRIFQKGKKRVKRIVCTEMSTGKKYLFSAVYEVRLVEAI
ncbi:MAG: hypothetical protein E6Q95_04065 [Chitinophagaceae bacterium]|nr:MAG: hypothetical protein E6Q95_04065 [Chitinophagaceae bacterium]